MFRRPPRNIVQVKTVLDTHKRGPRVRRKPRFGFFRSLREMPESTPAIRGVRERSASRRDSVPTAAGPSLKLQLIGLSVGVVLFLILGFYVWRELEGRRQPQQLLKSETATSQAN